MTQKCLPFTKVCGIWCLGYIRGGKLRSSLARVLLLHHDSTGHQEFYTHSFRARGATIAAISKLARGSQEEQSFRLHHPLLVVHSGPGGCMSTQESPLLTWAQGLQASKATIQLQLHGAVVYMQQNGAEQEEEKLFSSFGIIIHIFLKSSSVLLQNSVPKTAPQILLTLISFLQNQVFSKDHTEHRFE